MNRLSIWLNHGLKHARWPAARAARLVLLVALILSLAGIHLAQSSAIVAANRRVEALRRELQDLERRTALRLTSIGETTAVAKLKQRAAALGFQPAERIEFVVVPAGVRDDMPSLRDGTLRP